MEESEDVQDIIVNVDMNGVISELQMARQQNETIIENQETINATVQNGVLSCGMFLMVIAGLAVRNMILSWTKRGVKDV